MSKRTYYILISDDDKEHVDWALDAKVFRSASTFIDGLSADENGIGIVALAVDEIIETELLERIFQDKKDQPLLLVVEYREKKQVIEMLNKGFVFSYLLRPIDRKKFVHALDHLAEGRLGENDGDDYRRSPRIPISLWVEDLTNNLLPPIYTYNLSLSGVSLSTKFFPASTLLLGKELTLRFLLPDTIEPLSVGGKIMWFRRDVDNIIPGSCLVGIEFIDLSEENRKKINRFLVKYRYNILLISRDFTHFEELLKNDLEYLSLVKCKTLKHARSVLHSSPISFIVVDRTFPGEEMLDVLLMCKKLAPEAVKVFFGKFDKVELLSEAVNKGCIDRIVDSDPNQFTRSLHEMMEQYELKLYQQFLMKKHLNPEIEISEASIDKLGEERQESNFPRSTMFSYPDKTESATHEERVVALVAMLTYDVKDRSKLDQVLTLINTFFFEVGQIIIENGGESVDLPLYAKLALFKGSDFTVKIAALKTAERVRDYYNDCFSNLRGVQTRIGFGLDAGLLVIDGSIFSDPFANRFSGSALSTALLLASMQNDRVVVMTANLYQDCRTGIKAAPVILKGKTAFNSMYCLKEILA